jgi:hypothetical protein
MNRSQVLDFSEQELAALNARIDALVPDKDAWEDATDESDVDCDTLRHVQQRMSAFDSID